jgi:hypothetical protein
MHCVVLNYIFLDELLKKNTSRDTSVGIATDHGLDVRDSRFRFPAGAGNFSHHRVQNGTGAHPASYTMVTGVSLRGGKAAGA